MGLHTTNPPPNEFHARAHPVQNSPGTPKNTEIRPFLASRENFLPVPPPRNRAGRTFSRFQHQSTTHPVQNSPSNTHLKAHPVHNSPSNSHPRAQPVQNSPSTPKNTEIRPFQARRENFLPLPTPIHHSPGTKLSQHAQKHRNPAISSTQGEFPPASNTTPPSRENFLPLPTPIHHSPGTKLSPQHPPQGPSGTKLSPQQPPRAQPVQNSPGTPKNTEIRPFLASRENFLPVPTPRHRAGRIFSRFQHHLGAYFNAADRLVPTFTQAPDQCAPELGIVRVIGCSSRCSSRTRRD